MPRTTSTRSTRRDSAPLMMLSDGSERALRGVILTPTLVEAIEQQEQNDGPVLAAEVVAVQASGDTTEVEEDGSETEAEEEAGAAAHEEAAPPAHMGPLLLTFKPDEVASLQPVEAEKPAEAPVEKAAEGQKQLILFSKKPAVEGKRARLEVDVFDGSLFKKARFTANAPAALLGKEFKNINEAACKLRDALNPTSTSFGKCAGVNAKEALCRSVASVNSSWRYKSSV